jgi:hypothetical protein
MARDIDSANARIDYRSRRRGSLAGLHVVWRVGPPAGTAVPDSLDHFLIERYVLFAARGERLFRAQVHHQPYPLCGASLETLVMPDFAPYFIAGMTMFLLRRSASDWRLWVLLAGCWLVSLQRVELRALDLKPGFAVPVWPAMVLLTLAYGVLLAIALGVTDRLDWRWLGTAGALTYPFYLLHQRIGYSVIRTAHARTGLPAWVLIAGAVAALLVAAWLVHRLVERPLAPLLKRRILGRSNQVRSSE